MSRIFITGSADGLGMLAARSLIKDGHSVVLHARDQMRADVAKAASPGAEAVIIGDLSLIKQTIKVAKQVNDLGTFDAVIHNAGIGYRESKKNLTEDGIAQLFAVNSLAPYILTCLINKPSRLIYTSSGLHTQGSTSLNDIAWQTRNWDGFAAYADSKLHDVLLAFAVAYYWKDTLSNAVEPGWVATKMGGAGAPDSLEKGPETQAWLATSNDDEAMVSGEYFYHKKLKAPLPATKDKSLQDEFLYQCAKLSGIDFPK